MKPELGAKEAIIMAEVKKCDTCAHAIHCDTWGEVKCTYLKMRIYDFETMTECKFYKKRPKDFEEPNCQCEECVRRGEFDVEID